MIIGVDRLDYSKGLNLRLDAFEHFLRDLSGLARQGHLSADHAEEPQRNPRIRPDGADGQPERPAASTATIGEADWTPIRYVNRAYSRTALAGLLSRGARRAGDAAARRHEPRRQGICRRAGSGRSRRAGAVALRRRGARMQGGAAGQSLRHRGGRRRDRSRAVDAARRSGASATRRCTRRCCTTTSRTGPSASSRR